MKIAPKNHPLKMGWSQFMGPSTSTRQKLRAQLRKRPEVGGMMTPISSPQNVASLQVPSSYTVACKLGLSKLWTSFQTTLRERWFSQILYYITMYYHYIYICHIRDFFLYKLSNLYGNLVTPIPRSVPIRRGFPGLAAAWPWHHLERVVSPWDNAQFTLGWCENSPPLGRKNMGVWWGYRGKNDIYTNIIYRI